MHLIIAYVINVKTEWQMPICHKSNQTVCMCVCVKSILKPELNVSTV